MIKHYHNLYPLRNKKTCKIQNKYQFKIFACILLVLKINQQILHRWSETKNKNTTIVVYLVGTYA